MRQLLLLRACRTALAPRLSPAAAAAAVATVASSTMPPKKRAGQRAAGAKNKKKKGAARPVKDRDVAGVTLTIGRRQFTLGPQIGRGGFGTIHLAAEGTSKKAAADGDLVAKLVQAPPLGLLVAVAARTRARTQERAHPWLCHALLLV